MNKAAKKLTIAALIICSVSLVIRNIFNETNSIMLFLVEHEGMAYNVISIISTISIVIGLFLISVIFILGDVALILGCVGLKKSSELKEKTNCGFAIGGSAIILVHCMLYCFSAITGFMSTFVNL